MIDWRDDAADEAEFDKGFDKFIKDRNIKVFKKGDPPPEPTGSDSLRELARD